MNHIKKSLYFLVLLFCVGILNGCGSRLSDEALGLYAEGTELSDTKNFEAAIQKFDQALLIEPKFPELYLEKGRALQFLGEYEQALLNFDSVLAINSKFTEAYIYKARVLRLLDKLPESVASLDEALKLEPENVTVLTEKGFSAYALGDSKKALAFYDQALSLEPSYVDALQNKGVILADSDEDRSLSSSLAVFEQALSFGSGDYLNWYNKATVLSDLGYTLEDTSYSEKALFHYEKALELNPSYTDARMGQVATLYDLGEYNEALTVVKKTLIDNSGLVYGYYYKGLILGELGRLDEASIALNKVLELAPDHAEAKRELESLTLRNIVDEPTSLSEKIS